MIADLGGLRLFPTHNNRRPQSETGYHAEQHAPILAMQMWRSTVSPLARRRHEVPLFAMTTGFSWFPCFLGCRPLRQEAGVHLTVASCGCCNQVTPAPYWLDCRPPPQHCSSCMGDSVGAPLPEDRRPNLTVGPAVLVWVLTARFRLAPATNGRDRSRSVSTADHGVLGLSLDERWYREIGHREKDRHQDRPDRSLNPS
jgi:hypothetical protein